MICEWNLLFWTLALAYFSEKKNFSFDELADPVKKIAIPQHGPQNKLPNYTIMDTKYQNGLRKQIIATAKLTHFNQISDI